MDDWTSGYVTDIGYTYGYYTELNPERVKLAFLNQGWVYPQFINACELGFGQGLSINLHAAGSSTKWHGTDFNPSQASLAKELADISGSGVQLRDESFVEFCARADLPDFDYIGLHGIWTWVSDENRSTIVDFVRRKLAPGGVLYISYNALPGWSAFAPIRHLMRQHADTLSTKGSGIVKRIDGAIEFSEKLLATGPKFSRVNVHVGERFAQLKKHDREYLAHEYFGDHWVPMYFSDMAHWLRAAKVHYACSADYMDHIDTVNLTAEQQAFLADIADPMFRETTQDFMVNRQFRRDYWVKGARAMPAIELAELQRAQRIVLVTHRADVKLKTEGALGEVNLNEAIYGPILDLLSDHKVKTLGEIEQALAETNINFPRLFQAIMVLASDGHLAPVRDETSIAQSKIHTDRLNHHLCQKARSGKDIEYLVSPLTGEGIAVDRLQLLFLLCRSQGIKTPTEWADYVWQLLVIHGQKLVKHGITLETAEENLAEITDQAEAFVLKRLPIFKALQIA